MNFETDYDLLRDMCYPFTVTNTFKNTPIDTETHCCIVLTIEYIGEKYKSKAVLELKIDRNDYLFETTEYNIFTSGIDNNAFTNFIEDIFNGESDDIPFMCLSSIYTVVRDYLEENTVPNDKCFCFDDNDETSIQLPCYHYFHSDCISEISRKSKKKLCPMCRREFDASDDDLECVEIIEDKEEEKMWYVMEDNIYSPSKSMARHYYILIKNSGIKSCYTPHYFRAYMISHKPLSSEYNDELNGWVVGFQFKEQAEACMKQYNGKKLFNDYPAMDISLVSFNE